MLAPITVGSLWVRNPTNATRRSRGTMARVIRVFEDNRGEPMCTVRREGTKTGQVYHIDIFRRHYDPVAADHFIGEGI